MLVRPLECEPHEDGGRLFLKFVSKKLAMCLACGESE